MEAEPPVTPTIQSQSPRHLNLPPQRAKRVRGRAGEGAEPPVAPTIERPSLQHARHQRASWIPTPASWRPALENNQPVPKNLPPQRAKRVRGRAGVGAETPVAPTIERPSLQHARHQRASWIPTPASWRPALENNQPVPKNLPPQRAKRVRARAGEGAELSEEPIIQRHSPHHPKNEDS